MSAVVDQAIEDAAQSAIRPEIPLALLPDILGALQGRAMRDVMVMRVDQITCHGHTPENDDMLPIGWLPMEARQALERARDAMNAEQRDLCQVRDLLIQAVALGLAGLDRLDRGMKVGER